MGTRMNEYVKRRWIKLVNEFGGRCGLCGSIFDLEFAHMQPTECLGKGRGKSRRLFDILKNKTSYQLLCMDCHDRQDGRNLRRRQPEILRCL